MKEKEGWRVPSAAERKGLAISRGGGCKIKMRLGEQDGVGGGMRLKKRDSGDT